MRLASIRLRNVGVFEDTTLRFAEATPPASADADDDDVVAEPISAPFRSA